MEISNALRAEINTRSCEPRLVEDSSRTFHPFNVILERSPVERSDHPPALYKTLKTDEGIPNRRDKPHQSQKEMFKDPAIEAVRITMSNRETASQREKLKHLQRRNEQRGSQSLRTIRNYNIKDDELHRRSLNEPSTMGP